MRLRNWALVLAFAPVCGVRADSGLITPGATLQPVYNGANFYEGPSWDPFTGKLYFTDLTASVILRLDGLDNAPVWMNNTKGINGTQLGIDGRLLCAQGNAKAILALTVGLDAPEAQSVLASDNAWLAPNDLCQTAAGDIYFTTPNFSNTSGVGSYVYRRAANGVVTAVVTDMIRPNGIANSNDDKTLYVSDSVMKWWRSYPILPGGGVGPGTTFFNPPTGNSNDPDGMTVDELSNLYLNGRGGVWIVSPAGAQLEFVPVPASTFNTNATFGGADGKTLYITSSTKLYSLSMQVRGAQWRGTPLNNHPPQVDAGPDRTVNSRLRSNLPLNAVVSDDHLPSPPGSTIVKWYKVSGPGDVLFADRTSAATTASFSALGSYVLKVIAFDGIRSASDDVAVTINRAGDLDHDNDVDVSDFGLLRDCMTGDAGGPPAPSCSEADIDSDEDVDQSDFGLMQRCYTGAGQPSNPDCAS